MPRQARLDVAGALHHIMVRGINKSNIFEDDQDRSRFLERLGQTVIEVLSMRRKKLKEEADERIPGSGDFVQEILKEAEEKELRQLKLRQSGLNISEIIRQERGKSNVSQEELKRGSRRRRVSGVRAAIACRSSKELGLSGAEIARHLGVNTSSINRIIARSEDTAAD